jgi:hypothetical protein
MVFFVYNVLMTIRKGRALEKSESSAATAAATAA